MWRRKHEYKNLESSVYGWVMERKWTVFMTRMVHHARRFGGFEGGKEYMIYPHTFAFRI